MDNPTNELLTNHRVEGQALKVSLIAVITATCIASNYLLIGVINVKFMDLIVFASGFVFGPAIGASVGILTWLVYGALNPYGFFLPILIATSIGESLYGIIGGLLGLKGIDNFGAKLTVSIKFAIVGFLLTFIYDLATNIVSGLSFGIPLPIALMSGIPFAIAHEASNAAFFFVGALPLISAIGRLLPKGGNDG
ncbi:hypothetical protein MUO93_02490 [Candidatus Bathyarchaeota archaeon]|jgi:hypothetical protein|nr:hypothetical protein [Candidatus Bathyarchaeota archaeon]